MLIDLHTHTKEYSGCSRMDAESMIETAIMKGLGGVVLTEHDYMRCSDEVEALRKKFPQIKILNAIEVSIEEDEHVLVYGVSNPKPFYKHIPLRELEQVVKSENGIMVLAHPFRHKNEVSEEIFIRGIEGIEIASINVKKYMKKGYDYILGRKSLIKLTGSDAHDVSKVGLFATDFKADINNEADLVKAIRSKEFTLYKNSAEIAKLNEVLAEKIPLAKELIGKNLSNQEISKGVGGMSLSDIWVLKNNEDILYE